MDWSGCLVRWGGSVNASTAGLQPVSEGWIPSRSTNCMKIGDNIQTTQHWLDYNYGTVKPYRGIFLGLKKGNPLILRVQRHGVKRVEFWHRDFWEVTSCSLRASRKSSKRT